MKVYFVMNFGLDDDRWLKYPPEMSWYHGYCYEDVEGKCFAVIRESCIPRVVIPVLLLIRSDIWSGTISQLLKPGKVLPSYTIKDRDIHLLNAGSKKKLFRKIEDGKLSKGPDYHEPHRINLWITLGLMPRSQNYNEIRRYFVEHTPAHLLEEYPLASCTGGSMMREDLYQALFPYLDERCFLIECYELGNPKLLWSRP